jgi:hypothetical protein
MLPSKLTTDVIIQTSAHPQRMLSSKLNKIISKLKTFFLLFLTSLITEWCAPTDFLFLFFSQKEQFDWSITNIFGTWDTPQHRSLSMLPSPQKSMFVKLPPPQMETLRMKEDKSLNPL